MNNIIILHVQVRCKFNHVHKVCDNSRWGILTCCPWRRQVVMSCSVVRVKCMYEMAEYL